jgi:uncharacterized membrane protein YfcA
VSTYVLALLSGLLAGSMAGLFGVGGGIVLVPMLTLLGIPLHQAVALSLVYISCTSISGGLMHLRHGNIRPPMVLLLVLGSVGAVPLGTTLGHNLPDGPMAWAFAAFTLGVLVWFIYRSRIATPGEGASCSSFQLTVGALLIGAGAGFLSGLFGVGGGFIMVPLLSGGLGLPLRQSIGTSLGAVFLISLMGVFSHWQAGGFMPALQTFGPIVALAIAGGIVGAPVGARLTQMGSEQQLRRAFIVFIALVIAYLGYYGWSHS